MRIVTKGLAAAFAVILLTAGASLTEAQTQTYRGNFRTVRQLVLRLENRTDLFRNSLNARNRGRVSVADWQNLGNATADLDRAVNQLRDRFDRRVDTTADVQEVLNRAVLVERFITGVRGAALLRHWNNLRTDLNQLASVYNLSWPTVGQVYPPGAPVYGSNLLTGTYRLDPARSDNPATEANRAVQSVAARDRVRVRNQIAARLESPDELAIELRGREVTLASSRAPQISFSADGIERIETNNGRTIRARALLNGDQLIVSSTGDRNTEFNVTFNPIDNGRRLGVTRRVYVDGLSRPVVVQSTYNKVSDIARFDMNTGPQPHPTYPSGSGTDFIVRNGETVVASLNTQLSTETTREGDKFTATVRQPSHLMGAVLEGHVSSLERSGRVTGRSQMTLNFDTIRLRDGRSYRFAGILEQVRTPRGDTVKIDNEGAVRESSQTDTTVKRTAIGTAVGAIIGAIAGGGKGAAIGAIVGAGGGAGSVYVQGRDDLDLESGTELVIRASGPQ